MFGNKITELNAEQSKLFNSILPEKYHKPIWVKSDFLSGDLFRRAKKTIDEMEAQIYDLEKQIESKQKFKDELLETINYEKCSVLKIYNTNHINAKLIQMVDVGIVKSFTSASSGNRLEGGLMQLAVEKVFDDAWKTSNAQMKGLNEVKLEFLKKCINEHPECDSIINYQVDFRELGSTGNVFIYMRGTAAITGNPKLDKIKKGIEDKLNAFENKYDVEIPNKINEISQMFHKLKKTQSSIPNNFSGAIKLVNKLSNE